MVATNTWWFGTVSALAGAATAGGLQMLREVLTRHGAGYTAPATCHAGR